jgi:acyl carrier protein
MNNKIIEILNEIRPEFNFEEPIENFIEAGMLDSFDLVLLVTNLEQEFEVSIDGSDILPENFSSINGISALLTKSIKK